MNKMTQDMIKTIRTIKMMNNGKSTQKGRFLLCTSHEVQAVRLGRTTSPAGADHQSGQGGLWRTTLLILVMMTMGVGEMWADGYEGIYYIGVYGNGKTSQCASDNPADNFYLCPTEGWCYYNGETNNKGQITNENNGQPFLTSFKCRNGVYDATKAVWTIEKASGSYSSYYYIKQTCTGKYLVFNKQLNGAGANRARVHLETITPSAEEPNTYALFEISTVSTSDDRNGYYLFHPKEATSGYYMNITNGNVNSVSTPTGGKTDGPTAYDGAYKNVDGIVGQWNEANNTSSYKLEPYSPFITFNTSNQVEIKAAPSDATLVYTTDESDPAVSPLNGTEVNTNTVSVTPDDEVTTIKAIAIVNGVASAIATFTPPTLLGSSHKRLIQSQNNPWNTTDFHFYMIPGDDEGEDPNKITKVNTTSLFRPTMEWHLLYAGKDDLADNYLNQYYYIVNSNSNYLCYDGTNIVYMTEYNNDNKFKFKIEKSGSAGSFNIIPYDLRKESGNTPRFIYKKNGNDKNDAINITKDDNSNSRWKFVLPSSLDETAPFLVSNSTVTYYYKIASVGVPGHYIVPSTGNNANATTSNSADANVVKSGSWYFEVAQVASPSDWCTYYHIRNAETGEYLYFTKDANNYSTSPTSCLEMRNTIVAGDEDRYKFTWAKTAATTANYYIIPKLMKDFKLNYFSALRRHDSNTSILTNVTRDAGKFAWTFTPADLFCNTPEFVEEEGVIKIKCSTNAAKIYINTESNADPTIADENLYAPTTNENQNWATTTQIRIKAIAVVSDGASPTPNTASSAVVTLLNKPDVTLTTASYEYDGTAKTFEKSNIAEVSITANEVKTTADASTYDIDAFENNIVAGTPSSATPPTVNLKDIAGDSWYILNASAAFTITPKALTITAASDSKVYDGAALTKDSYTNTALADGDAIESVTVTGSQTVVGGGDNVPSAAVIKKGEEDRTACYEITYANGTLTVTKKALTITADNDTKVYDGTALTKSSYTNTDLADGDAIESVTVTGSQTVVGGSDNVPSAAVIKKGEEDRTSCYEITYTNGTLTVTKKALTITADSDTKVYDGTALTKNSYTNSDLADGDAIESVTVTGSQTIVGSSDNVPSAAVIKKGEENRTACYDITYTNGTLTVTAIGVTVTAENKSKVYSKNPATDPALTATVTGLIGTDEVTYTISRAAGEDVNNYVITPSGESAQGNYTVTYVPGTFTINPAALTITPDDGQSKQYGDPDPELTYTSAGLMEGDALAGALARAEGENANSDGYAITQGTIDDSHNPNYTITFTTGKTFAITPKSLGSGNTPAENITVEITEANVDHVVVKQGGKTLREGNEGTNYDYSISAEGDATTKYYKVTIYGRNNYEGSFKATFANINLSKREGSSYAGGAATFVSNGGDGNFAVPDDMVAYIVTGINAVAGTVVVEPLDNIPEQVPVLLLSTIDANGFVVTPKNDGTNPTGTNLLQEATGDVAARTFPTAEIYLLYKGEFVLNAAGTLPVGKVYLRKPSGETPAPAILSIDWDNVTGIEDVRGKMEEVRSDYWYTLDGRRLSGKPTKKGLYINNGNMVVIK